MSEDYSESVVKLLFETINLSKDGVGIFDKRDILIYCNRSMANYYGFNDVSDALGRSFEEILRLSYASGYGVKADDDDIDGLVTRAKKNRLKPGFSSFEMESATGKWSHVSRIRTDDSNIFIYIKDITLLKSAESDLKDALKHLKLISSTDSLTGISNRRNFMELGVTEVERSHRYKYPLSLLALDIDHFKSINDTYGHLAGDKVLKKIAQCCSKLLRDSDLFARLGGEEFSILLPHTDREGAEVMANRVLKSVAEAEVPYEGQKIRFTTSIGIALVGDHCDNLELLMKHSDEALYQAKNSGRNKVSIWQ